MFKSMHLKLILLTPVFWVLAHHLAVFMHEYAHSFTAWALGHKPNPWIIEFGGTSWVNLLLLYNIDEFVNYPPIFASGHPIHVALIAIAGIGICVALFIITQALLKKSTIQQHPILYYFLVWFAFWNMTGIYAYIPIRTLVTHADMANFAAGFHISTWWIYIFGGYAVAFLIWYFYSNLLNSTYFILKIEAIAGRVALMMILVITQFGLVGLIGLVGYGVIAQVFSITSFFAMPGLMLIFWPSGKGLVINKLGSVKV